MDYRFYLARGEGDRVFINLTQISTSDRIQNARTGPEIPRAEAQNHTQNRISTQDRTHAKTSHEHAAIEICVLSNLNRGPRTHARTKALTRTGHDTPPTAQSRTKPHRQNSNTRTGQTDAHANTHTHRDRRMMSINRRHRPPHAHTHSATTARERERLRDHRRAPPTPP